MTNDKEKCNFCYGKGENTRFGFRGVFTFYNEACHYCDGTGYRSLPKKAEDKDYGYYIKQLEEER